MKNQARVLSFKRISESGFVGFADSLRSDDRFRDKDIDVLLRLIGPGGLIRPNGDQSPVGDLFKYFTTTAAPGVNFVARDLVDLAIQMSNYLWELYATPYRLNLINMLNEPVQYVWAYELHSGMILVDQSTYTQPGATATLATTSTNPFISCVQVKQYAISVWDQNDEEIGRIPNLIVEKINEVETRKGTWRACEDTIEIGS